MFLQLLLWDFLKLMSIQTLTSHPVSFHLSPFVCYIFILAHSPTLKNSFFSLPDSFSSCLIDSRQGGLLDFAAPVAAVAAAVGALVYQVDTVLDDHLEEISAPAPVDLDAAA